MNTMKELTVRVRNRSVVGVNGLEKGQRYVCVDTLPLIYGIGTEESYRALYDRQKVEESCPLVLLAHRGVKEMRVAEGYSVTIEEFEQPWTAADIFPPRR